MVAFLQCGILFFVVVKPGGHLSVSTIAVAHIQKGNLTQLYV